jgi:hypothetical protein
LVGKVVSVQEPGQWVSEHLLDWYGTTVADFLTSTYPFTTWLASLCLICHTRPTWTNR